MPTDMEQYLGDPVTSREDARERLPKLRREDLGLALVHLAHAVLNRTDEDRDADTGLRARAYVAMELGFQMSGQYVDRLETRDPTWPPEEDDDGS